jgi:hypothetical protein
MARKSVAVSYPCRGPAEARALLARVFLRRHAWVVYHKMFIGWLREENERLRTEIERLEAGIARDVVGEPAGAAARYPRRGPRAQIREVVHALGEWMRTRDSTLSFRVLFRLMKVNKEWRHVVRSEPLYISFGEARLRMQIKHVEGARGLFGVRQGKRAWAMQWVRGEGGCSTILLLETGRRDMTFREGLSLGGLWPGIPARHLVVAFDTLRVRRDVKLLHKVYHGLWGMAKELLTRLHKRSPAAVMIWEAAFTFATGACLDVLQFDWPVYYRQCDWRADLAILREAARMWELTGPPPGETVHAYLVYSVRPSTLLQQEDCQRVEKRMRQKGVPVGVQVMPFGDLRCSKKFKYLNECVKVTPETDTALRLVFARASCAEALIKESVFLWKLRKGTLSLLPTDAFAAETYFLNSIGFRLHDRGMAGPSPDEIDSEETIMLNTRRIVRLRDGVMTVRDEAVGAGGAPVANVLRLRFGEEVLDASADGAPTVVKAEEVAQAEEIVQAAAGGA